MKLCTLILMLFVLSTNAATYYVATTGNDGDPGTEGEPFLTIQKGVNIAQGGDTVLVAAGTYDAAVTTVTNGSSGAIIVLDGQNVATMRNIVLAHEYFYVQNFTIAGLTSNGQILMAFNRGAHNCVVSNNYMDALLTNGVAGVSWQPPITLPFDSLAGSTNLLVSNTVTRVMGAAMLSIYGDNNTVLGNNLIDGASVDFLRLFGRTNHINSNVFSNNYVAVPEVGYHPDFVQTFGDNNHGSMGHVFDGNIVKEAFAAQLGQMTSDLHADVIRDWTFRNNVFVDIGFGLNILIEDVKFYNNIFLRCNLTNGGHVLSFAPLTYTAPTNVPSGSIVNGLTYRCVSSDQLGEITYATIVYTNGQDFVGDGDATYSASGDAEARLRETEYAHGGRVFNNSFIDIGDSRTTVGWYNFDLTLTNIQADYNYVGKDSYGTLATNVLEESIGDPGGWDNNKLWEDNGINGGDPLFMSATDFQLQSGSPLIGAALELNSLFTTDFIGVTRGDVWDIGPYEYEAQALVNPIRGGTSGRIGAGGLMRR